MRLKLDREAAGLSSVMERLTGARVKDCFTDMDIVYFIVAKGDMGKAIGKKGIMIKKVQAALGKKIRVIPFTEELAGFVRNVVSPIQVEEVTLKEDVVFLKDSNKKTKSLLIGRDGRNLVFLTRAVKRFFPVKEVKVI